MKTTSRRQRGVAIIECALVLPLFILLTFAVVDFGRALYQYNTLTKAVRDAARYLSMFPAGSAEHVTAAQNLILYGSPTPGTEPLASGLTSANISAPVWSSSGTDPTITTVTVRVANFGFTSMFGSVLGVNFGNFTFSDITATMRSQV